ncbi:hypothetical protein [Pantoea sp. ANP04]|jgi:hypothetical protein|uniref:hypothetical protein n=1 Tax=Pantoea sp. ANP04 TaxID=3064896 RepID=UPI0035C595DD
MDKYLLWSFIIIGVVILVLLGFNRSFRRDIGNIVGYNGSPTKEEFDKQLLPIWPRVRKPYDKVAFSAQHLQAYAQKIIFICLSLLLMAKGVIEILDTLNVFDKVNVSHVIYYWSVRDFHLIKLTWTESVDRWPLISHVRHIKTLTYVANALAISCGLQLAYMLVTEGPDEAVEPIMLGIASVILLILSTIEPSQWSIYNSISIILLILGIFLLYYMSGKINKN